MASVLTWEELGARSLARQFPDVAGRDVDAVVATVGATGPVQSQTARSPYLGLAARMPGVEHEAVTAAYEQARLLRGSTLRGTVHTSTAADHALLSVATRTGLRRHYERTWQLADLTVDDGWTELERYAAEEWRTAQELHDHLRGWLDEHDPGHRARLDDTAGRSLSYCHGALVRRPLTGGWEGQGRAGYRTARVLLGGAVDDATHDRAPRRVEDALDALVRRHLRWHGPSSRHDVSWWSGLGLTVVDACLDRLAGTAETPGAEVVTHEGPDGRAYHELADAPAPRELHDVRLLPEFDATLCAYDAKRRDRFVTPEHFARLWHQANALIEAPLMVDGRLTGRWRLTGSGRRRHLEVGWFRGTRRPRRAELDAPVGALEAAYGVTVTGVALASAG